MSDQPKPRLSDIAKKNTTDRASKLAGSFVPPPPPASPPVVAAQSPSQELELTQEHQPNSDSLELPDIGREADPSEPGEVPVTPVAQVGAAGLTPGAKATSAAAPRPKERTRRPGSISGQIETVVQPVPEGTQFSKLISVCEDHHDLLRELSYRGKKPMTTILYNLLELGKQAIQPEPKKPN